MNVRLVDAARREGDRPRERSAATLISIDKQLRGVDSSDFEVRVTAAVVGYLVADPQVLPAIFEPT